MKILSSVVLFLFMNNMLVAQTKAKDSASAAKILKTLSHMIRLVNLHDTGSILKGKLDKVAPYIIYRGKDKKRNWKTFCVPANKEDRERIIEICRKINHLINLDSVYTIVKYHTKKESEGIWHALDITYHKMGEEKKIIFAFLKIGKRMGLGDISRD